MKKEVTPKNRKWVIKFAVVFFVILLLLTFFSNTIMNYSLPKVSIKHVETGAIASRVRGSGTATVADPVNVTVKTERKVKAVAVKNGDEVTAGTILVMFTEDSANDELAQAQKAVDDAKDAYQQYIVTNEISDETVVRVESGASKDYSYYRNQLKAASDVEEACKKQVADATAVVKALEAQIEALENSHVTASYAGFVSVGEYDDDYDYNQYDNGSDGMTEDYWGTNEDNGFSDNSSGNDSENQQSEEEIAYQNELASLKNQLNAANASLTAATETQTKAESDHQKVLDAMNSEISLTGLYDALQEANAALAKVDTSEVSNKITASVSGTIADLAVAKGDTVTPDMPLMTIVSSDTSYTATLTVTPEQASRVKVGDTADIDESWYYENISAVVSGIRNDKENPGKSKLIDIKITGDVTAGAELTFAIGEKSSSYDMLVPNGTIREDKNGKFILVIREKSSPLGNRYFARRVDVKVLASDDVHSAISGDLEGYESIIFTSTKAISAGDQVRLTES